jgi:nucleotide-binding universal stress UspA family protein
MSPTKRDSLAFHVILVPYDFSPAAATALRRAVEIAATTGAALHLLHARLPGEEARSLADIAAPHGATIHVRDDRAAHAICALAVEIGADLIVMATHRDESFARALVSSAVVRTIRHAPCEVLIVPSDAVARPAKG